ncbi:L,D-transpeptidase family protein [Denitrobaculum tricleocarpae]|uniref:L,D-transpeptidase family protein n=1 Tax=Denitrobaculum tricleocarpae TaxID=2591009 RepID=A0A545TB69_9PROT|nr:L,D-transpeptidase family protein [Denitrobaculum tricleocarpae]TQV74446.1 L,D-transpeptidase family protein [Denitrobaculum tricleocarpae]
MFKKKPANHRRLFLTGALTAAASLTLGSIYAFGRPYWVPTMRSVTGRQTVRSVLDHYGESASARLLPFFEEARVSFPPKRVTLLALKQERKLEVWAQGDPTGTGESPFTFIRDYDIRKASGVAGPKLREGDRQVPEGLYKIVGLNPNSSYHLSMKLNYPNSFDLKHAQAEGRTEPGSNIFIHGNSLSVGCLAMGDEVIEELFVLTALTGRERVKVAIAPRDPRTKVLKADPNSMPAWTPELYDSLVDEFKKYPRPI